MKDTVNKKNVLNILWIIILFLFFPASCVYDKEFVYINDQIIALNKKVSALQGSIDSKVAQVEEKVNTRLEKDLDEKIGAVSSSQANMTIELENIKRDVLELGGRVEDNEHIIKRTVEKDLSEQDAVRKDLARLDDITLRIEELERAVRQQYAYLGLTPPQAAAPVGAAITPEGGETGSGTANTGVTASTGTTAGIAPGLKESELYDISLSLFREEKYEQAMEGFRRFLEEYKNSDLADNAQFWIGESLMALKQYEQAILAYQEVIKNYPKGNKVPNAMLRQALAFLEIKDTTSSKLLLKKVIKQFPNSNEAKIAETKLKTMN